ncbi:hypothetical protein MHK_010874 [Candidatus Magnetomorum sp. HK-1]|nr:hypothetical protein MHK_010874 [Candidatus Magnetomorum sp. HK-1]
MLNKSKIREKSLLTLKEKAAYTMIEFLIILILLGIVSGVIASKYIGTKSNYELISDAHELRSNLRLMQAKSMQYYEQKKYPNSEMRDNDLWGISFPSKKNYEIIRKQKSEITDKSEIQEPIYYNKNIYPLNEKRITYELNNSCAGNDVILFNALGKPVDFKGNQCEKTIVINVKKDDARATLMIQCTGHIDINY